MRLERARNRGASRLGGAAIAAAAIALAFPAAVSCDFMSADMFPKELQYAAGDYDLAAEQGCAPDEIGELRIEALRSLEGTTGVFAVVNRTDGWHLAILDGAMDRIASYKASSFSWFLGSYSGDESFVCGRASLGYDFVMNVPGTMAGCLDESVDVAATDYVIDWWNTAAGTWLNICNKASGISVAYDTQLASGSFFSVLDGSRLFAGTASPRFFLLARSDSGNGGDALCLGFTDAYASLATSMDGTPLETNAQIDATRIHTDYVDGGWITDDGIVLLVHGRDTRLARFAFGTGEELDSLRVDSEWMRAVSFEDSGDYWYCYDRGTGRVKRMRAWWR